MPKVELSVIVIGFDMPREIPRTVRSLSPEMQRGVERDDYEIILVDNGSRRPFDEKACYAAGANLRIVRHSSRWPSPCEAINLGLAAASGELCGVWIDGARLASPGILAGALACRSLHVRPTISTLGFHLGPAKQSVSTLHGYDEKEEDRLLESVGWTEDGYRLFDIACFAGSSEHGWFAPMAESNALFMPRSLWSELGGYDERFRALGGGLANLDVYRRACELPNSQLITLLGEGTFHQIHGGVTTGPQASRLDEFYREYESIRGTRFERSSRLPIYYGSVPLSILPSVGESVKWRTQAVESPPIYAWRHAVSGQATIADERSATPGGWIANAFAALSIRRRLAAASTAQAASSSGQQPSRPQVLSPSGERPVDSVTDRIYAAVSRDPRVSLEDLKAEVGELQQLDSTERRKA